MYRQDSFIQQLQFLRPLIVQGKTVGDPLPVDITGAQINFTVKKVLQSYDGDPNVWIYSAATTGVSIDVPLSGLFTVSLQPTDTKFLEDGDVALEYDVKIAEAVTFPNRVTTSHTGTITVHPSVFRGIQAGPPQPYNIP